MIDLLIDTLRSDSLHARYGAVKALRKIGPDIVKSVSPLLMSSHESDLTRLSALEAIRLFPSVLGENDLVALSSILIEPHTAALKIEVIKLLKLYRCIRALPAIRQCLGDDTVDERIQSWGFGDEEYQVLAYAADAIVAIEQGAQSSHSTDASPAMPNPSDNSISIADILGPWVEPEWDSSLIDRCRRAWNRPLRDLSREELATLLLQRIALEHVLPVAKHRVLTTDDDGTEWYTDQLKKAIEYASTVATAARLQ